MQLKHLKFFLFALVVSATAFALSGCGDDDTKTTNQTAVCMGCHNETSETGMALRFAQAGYENSGHWLGPRTLDPNTTTTGHMYVHHGSNAAYCADSCHNHEGFIASLTGGTSTATYPSPTGCFTCHAPHESGSFTLRTTAAVTLKDGTTFNSGKGNLCAHCHMANYVATDHFVFSTATASLANYRGPHHGPQADIFTGANAFPWSNSTAITNITNVNGSFTDPTGGAGYLATGDHANNVTDSCVQCHMYSAAGDNDSLALGGHGFYLTGDVHGSSYDLTATCKASTCHPSGWSAFGATFANETNHPAPTNWDNIGASPSSMVAEITGMLDTLAVYFGTAANFDGGVAPIELHGGGDIASGDLWGLDWDFKTGNLNQAQAASLWNFRLALEDKSKGVHNAVYVAQLLWDAIKNLNDNAGAALNLGGTRP